MQVAPSQISPGENFDIFYFLRNHTDSATYYIRAVTYDVRTGEVLLTTDLAQSPTNTRLFSKTVQAPADPTGIGRNIAVVATVYTDSGYTTKSTDYEETEQYYLVRAVPPVLGGGGMDYRTLREIVQEELQKATALIPKPAELPEMPWNAVFGTLGTIQREVNRVPKEQFDAAAIIERLAALQEQITALPTRETADLTPLVTQLRAILAAVLAIPREAKAREPISFTRFTQDNSSKEPTAAAMPDIRHLLV